tara:strand:- start:1261 stop:1827 length:567 start_codon:yes stop_codon:yes gene_type:complete
MENVFKKLSTISIKDKVEKKGKLDYLSWANAWALLKQNYPTAQRIVYEDPATGLNYFTDGKTCYVKIGIVVNELEHIDYLPIMDFRNAAIVVDKVTMFDVNKTIQRSTVKAIGLHGLGLSLWIGEDIKEAPPLKTASKKPGLLLNDVNYKKIVNYIEENKELDRNLILNNVLKKYTVESQLLKRLKDV